MKPDASGQRWPDPTRHRHLDGPPREAVESEQVGGGPMGDHRVGPGRQARREKASIPGEVMAGDRQDAAGDPSEAASGYPLTDLVGAEAGNAGLLDGEQPALGHGERGDEVIGSGVHTLCVCAGRSKSEVLPACVNDSGT